MLRHNLRTSLLGTCAVAALTMAVSNGAQAQAVTVYGGGSTLAAVIYGQIFSTTLASNYPDVTVVYEAVGSGAGTRGFACNDATQDTPLTSGTDITYGATDNLLTSAQITTWNNSKAITSGGGSSCTPATTGTIGIAQSGPIIQVPTIGTPVTLAYNIPTRVGGTTPQLGNLGLTFTDAQLCGIFSGKITSWTDAALSGVYHSTGRNQAPSGTINVVYRSDGSGTSNLFTAHLAAVCTTSEVPTGFTFTATQTFASLFSTVPSNFTGESGSGGVATQIGPYQTSAGHPNSIGYLSPDYTKEAPNNSTSSSFPPVAYVFNTHVSGSPIEPSVANTQASLALATYTNTVFPSGTTPGANGTSLVPAVADPTTGYPIVGYTTLLLATCYNDPTGNVVGGLEEFLLLLYGDTPTQNLLEAAGFSPLPTGISGLVTDNIINNNNGENIDIQDPAAGCGTTYAGR